MTTLTLDRPSIAHLAATTMDAVFKFPRRVAHAYELSTEVERIVAMSDEQIAATGTTREVLLRELAQRA